jgi:hypothetical protein
MDTQPPQKKGLGPLAWLGIGCGGIIILCVIAVVIGVGALGGNIKEWAEDFQKNPARVTATTMARLPGLEMVAEDDVNKRYTIKETKSGSLTTIYWDEKSKTAVTIPGDFSKIPKGDSETAPPATPAVQ